MPRKPPRFALLLGATLLSGCLPPQIAANGLGSLFGRGVPTNIASSACPDLEGTVGNNRIGAYSGLMLPRRWEDIGSEAEVTRAIAALESGAASLTTWACFQKDYPTAVMIYRVRVGGNAATPSPTLHSPTMPTSSPRAPAPSHVPSYVPSYAPTYLPSYVPSTPPSPVAGVPDDAGWSEEGDGGPPPSAADLDTTEIQGRVYDVFGEPIEGATITLRSLDAARPYSRTSTTSSSGLYYIYAPIGVPVEIVASLGSRRQWRTSSFDGDDNVLNFGASADGTSSDDDPLGEDYPL